LVVRKPFVVLHLQRYNIAKGISSFLWVVLWVVFRQFPDSS